ncbi:hypothetical protein ALC53_10410 [Atta colombica]|uniref:Uncharacterized protein n=1 Tax=Atta colombica TaxID=520822 RepID=A0A195B4Y7_9HYME|nr:hypothetical protein ALC53_10410 [Atta colombica]
MEDEGTLGYKLSGNDSIAYRPLGSPEEVFHVLLRYTILYEKRSYEGVQDAYVFAKFAKKIEMDGRFECLAAAARPYKNTRMNTYDNGKFHTTMLERPTGHRALLSDRSALVPACTEACTVFMYFYVSTLTGDGAKLTGSRAMRHSNCTNQPHAFPPANGVKNSTAAILILRKFRNEYRLGLIFLYSSGVKMDVTGKTSLLVAVSEHKCGNDVRPEKQSHSVVADINHLKHKYVAHECISWLHISRELAEARRHCNIICVYYIARARARARARVCVCVCVCTTMRCSDAARVSVCTGHRCVVGRPGDSRNNPR